MYVVCIYLSIYLSMISIIHLSIYIIAIYSFIYLSTPVRDDDVDVQYRIRYQKRTNKKFKFCVVRIIYVIGLIYL